MTSSPTCPRCGSPLAPSSPAGLCPRCLLAMNLRTRTMPTGEQASSSPPPAPAELEAKFPQFEILECLGRGGMGVVYKARQKALDRIVAIKILAGEFQDDPGFATRFEKEAKLLARLNHPNIVTIHDFGHAGGLFHIVMEYIDGVNVRDLLRDGRLEPEQALAIVPPICDALQFAHDHGVVHRDIKPENILLDREGRVKIADFGIATIAGEAADRSGTPDYMAPEISGHSSAIDHRADIYSLGVVLYEMLTGHRPDKQIQVPSSRVQLDVKIDEIVLRALQGKPELRYQTAGEFKTVVATMAPPAKTPPPPSQSPPAAPAPATPAPIPRPKTGPVPLAARVPATAALAESAITEPQHHAHTAILLLLVALLGTPVLLSLVPHTREGGWVVFFGFCCAVASMIFGFMARRTRGGRGVLIFWSALVFLTILAVGIYGLQQKDRALDNAQAAESRQRELAAYAAAEAAARQHAWDGLEFRWKMVELADDASGFLSAPDRAEAGADGLVPLSAVVATPADLDFARMVFPDGQGQQTLLLGFKPEVLARLEKESAAQPRNLAVLWHGRVTHSISLGQLGRPAIALPLRGTWMDAKEVWAALNAAGVGSGAIKHDPSAVLYITFDKAGKLAIGGQSVPSVEFRATLAAMTTRSGVTQTKDPRAEIVSTSPDVDFNRLGEILKDCQSLGIRRISFRTESTRREAAPPPAVRLELGAEEGALRLDGFPVSAAELPGLLQKIATGRPLRALYLAYLGLSDSPQHQRAVELLKLARDCGFEQLAYTTQTAVITEWLQQHEQRTAALAVPAPAAGTPPVVPLVIRIAPDGSCNLDGQALDAGSLLRELHKHTTANPDLAVKIQAGAAVPYAEVLAVLELCQQAAVKNPMLQQVEAETAEERPNTPAVTVRIAIAADGVTSLDGRAMPHEELLGELRKLKERNINPYIEVAPDSSLPYSAALPVVELCHRASLANVTILQAVLEAVPPFPRAGPEANGEPLLPELEPVRIRIAADESLTLDGESVTLEQLREKLMALARQGGSARPVVVSGRPTVRATRIREVMEACGQADLTRISLEKAEGRLREIDLAIALESYETLQTRLRDARLERELLTASGSGEGDEELIKAERLIATLQQQADEERTAIQKLQSEIESNK